jgi:hypothetical protein
VLIAAVPDRDRALVEETLMRRLEDLTVTALWEAEKRLTMSTPKGTPPPSKPPKTNPPPNQGQRPPANPKR